MQIAIGEEGGAYTALRGSFIGMLKELSFHHSGFEKRLNEAKHPSILNASTDQVQEDVVLHMIEASRNVSLNVSL